MSHPLYFTVLTLVFSILVQFSTAQPFTSFVPPGPSCNHSTNPAGYITCGYGHTIRVTNPPELTGAIAYHPFSVVKPLQVEGDFTGRLIIPNTREPSWGLANNAGNIFGCNPPGYNFSSRAPIFQYTSSDDGTPYAGSILLIQRNTCAHSVRQLAADIAGVGLLIVVDNQSPSARRILGGAPSTPTGVEVYDMKVPAIIISQTDGGRLVRALQQNPNMTITVSMKGAGRITQSNKDALVDLASQLIFGSTAPGSSSVYLNRHVSRWSAMASIDPCWDGVIGVWCEDGEVTSLFLDSWSVSGVIHPSISKLTKLVRIMILNNAISGPFPTSICDNPASLSWRYVNIATNRFTSVPDCFHLIPQLQSLAVDDNQITQFPMNVLRSSTLMNVGFSLNRNMIGSLSTPINAPLTILEVQNARLSGSIPSFTGLFPNITILNFGANQFTGTVDSNFDNLPMLQSLQLQRNQLTGSLPNLISSQSQWTRVLDFSFNQFTGGIPASWGLVMVNRLTTLGLNDNLLDAQIGLWTILKQATSLTSLDLSNNRIGIPDPVGTPTSNSAVGFAAAISSTSMQSINLAGNLLRGNNPFGWFHQITSSVRRISFANNQITGMPPDLFNNLFLQVIDFSNNSLTGVLPTATPPAQLQVIDVRNNPRLGSGSIPTYLAINTATLTQAAESLFACFAVIGGSTNPGLTVFFDPSYYAYSNCFCQSGTFGLPPSCAAIPATFSSAPQLRPEVSASTIASALPTATNAPVLLRSFTDQWYGSRRSLSGLDSSWAIDVSQTRLLYRNGNTNLTFVDASSGQSSIAPVVITITIIFNKALFRESTDVLAIYSGDSNLNGAIIQQFRGNDILNVPQIHINDSRISHLPSDVLSAITPFPAMSMAQVQVIGVKATARFQSRKSSGQHFYAAYTASENCPDGYLKLVSPNQEGLFCERIKSLHRVSDSLLIAIYAIAGAVSFIVLIVMAIISFFAQTALVRASSRQFVAIILVSLLWMAGSSVLYAIVPDGSNGDTICKARVWCSALSLMGILSVLVAKSFRVSVIFGSRVMLKIKNVQDYHVFMMSSAMILAQLIMLIVFESLDMSFSAQMSYGSNELVWGCSTGNGFDAWMGVEIALIAVIMAGGGVVAFRTRSVPSAFNESTHILLSLQLLMLFMILIVPLNWALVQSSPEASIVIQGGGQIVLSLFLLGSNFFPKLYYLLSGHGNDKSLVFPSKKSSFVSSENPTTSSAASNGSVSAEMTGHSL